MVFLKGHKKFGNGGFKKGYIPWNKIKKIKRKCPLCNKEYFIPISKTVGAGYRKYCKRKCFYLAQKNRKPWNKNKKTGIIPRSVFQRHCIPWNKGLTKKDTRIQKMIETRKKTDSYKHTEKTKEKIKDAAIKQMKNKKYRDAARERMIERLRSRKNSYFKDTIIELKIQDELRKKNIEFEKHKSLLKKYVVDLFVKPNIVIECDGCYWHNCLIHFPEKHKERRKRDELKSSELQKHNYIVLRFWDHEINDDIKKCVDSILLYVYGQRKNL